MDNGRTEQNDSSQIVVKRFCELTVYELYGLLYLREDAFKMDMKIFYRDLDMMDQDAYHVLLEEDGKVLAYVRIMGKGTVFDEICFTRVVSSERGKGYGMKVMEGALRFTEQVLNEHKVRIHAQAYATGFYEKLGFKCIGGIHDYNGVPHVEMLYDSDSE